MCVSVFVVQQVGSDTCSGVFHLLTPQGSLLESAPTAETTSGSNLGRSSRILKSAPPAWQRMPRRRRLARSSASTQYRPARGNTPGPVTISIIQDRGLKRSCPLAD